MSLIASPLSGMHSGRRLASLWERQRQIGANFSTVVYEGFEAVNVCGGPCLGAFRAGGRVTCLLPGRYQPALRNLGISERRNFCSLGTKSGFGSLALPGSDQSLITNRQSRLRLPYELTGSPDSLELPP